MAAEVNKPTAELQHALAYAENIVATLREPFVVLDKTLRVRTANGAFYRDFHASKGRYGGPLRLRPGNGQWDIPQLRALLSQVLSNSNPVEDFEVEHVFPDLGPRNMLLNARRFPPESSERIWSFWPSRTLRSPARGSRHQGLRSPLSAAVPVGQGRHPHPCRRHGKVIDVNPFMPTCWLLAR